MVVCRELAQAQKCLNLQPLSGELSESVPKSQAPKTGLILPLSEIVKLELG